MRPFEVVSRHHHDVHHLRHGGQQNRLPLPRVAGALVVFDQLLLRLLVGEEDLW